MVPVDSPDVGAGPGTPRPRVRFATGTTVKDYDWYRRWLSVAESCGFEMLTAGDSQIADGVILSNALDDATSEPATTAGWRGHRVGHGDVQPGPAGPLGSEGVDRLRFLLAGTANHVYRSHMDR